jgi:chitinase
MRHRFPSVLFILMLLARLAYAQGTVPTFTRTSSGQSYTFAGHDPMRGGTTGISTILVPVTLVFEPQGHNPPASISAAPDVPAVLASPIFSPFSFELGSPAQYGDAMLRATFPAAADWHTLLAKPALQPVTISVPASDGYILTSRKNGGVLAVVDADYLQDQLFQKIPEQDGKLVIALTHNITFYVDHDATICCTWGTHGIDQHTGASFVLGTYFDHAPSIITDADVQPLSQQLAEFLMDPHHNPQVYGFGVTGPGNRVPPWMRADGSCGGRGIGSDYFLLEPTDTNLKNNFPASPPFVAHTASATYHLQNVALLPWYVPAVSGAGTTFSFPNPAALQASAVACDRRAKPVTSQPSASPISSSAPGSHHELIGYWTGEGTSGEPFPLHAVSPQWDVVIVAFDAPVKGAPEGTLSFQLPAGLDQAEFKHDIAGLKQSGKKVMLSLGGGGAYFTLHRSESVPAFVTGVSRLVEEYGFDGVDIDFETPSLVLDPGDVDFKHPTTPSIVNLITALRQLHDHFGSRFMLSLVPEGPQLAAGYLTYGGQFGSYLPLIHGLRDIISLVDIQDYNTPPLEGLDGEIYQAHTVDYHAALTELALRGFAVAGDHAHLFKPLAADRIAAGFLTDYDTPQNVSEAMRYIIAGKAPLGTHYKLQRPSGYPSTLGAMFWTIDDDRARSYSFSDLVGPELHGRSGAPATQEQR